jgi:trans-2,3-dihydro-3-hydroxyanthranilate isomerase
VAEPIEALRSFSPFAAADAPHTRLRYLLLDVFTQTPLQGNQLAVFPDAGTLAAETMQALARELRLPESVFFAGEEGGGELAMRIFTPASELPFAGHPVLGSAVVAGAALGRDSVTLRTGAGPVEVSLEQARGRARFARMVQPLPTWETFEQRSELLRALAVERSSLPIEVYCNGPRHVYVTVERVEEVQALRPDMGALARLGELGVSCFAASGRSVRTRMFAPGLGIDEDPATGSAAGPLAVHLARHGRVAFGQEVEITQGVELARPSQLLARALGTPERIERVEVGGWALIVGEGELRP